MEQYNRIAPDVKLGNDVRLACYINAYGCSIDDGTRVGSFVEIQKNASIGRNCKIQSHTFICEGVHIRDNVFIGHNVTFINDNYPHATNPDGTLQTEKDWVCLPTVVESNVSIGSSVTILGGVTIGEGAMIGAGSVVTRSIPPGEIWAGNPARFKRKGEPYANTAD